MTAGRYEVFGDNAFLPLALVLELSLYFSGGMENG